MNMSYSKSWKIINRAEKNWAFGFLIGVMVERMVEARPSHRKEEPLWSDIMPW